MMDELGVLIVDDEAPARARLHQLVDGIEGCVAVGEAGNGIDALRLAADLAPAIVLLDIRMPGMDGLEAARHLAGMNSPPAVIFTTAFDQYAVDAFQTHAVGYLLKPVRRQKLNDAITSASRLTAAQLAALASDDSQQARRHICARMGGEMRLIPLEDIRWFKAGQKYVAVCHTGGEELIDESLKALESEFADTFIRVHRNSLAAIAHIRTMQRDDEGHYALTIDGVDETLSVSRRHVSEVKSRLKSG